MATAMLIHVERNTSCTLLSLVARSLRRCMQLSEFNNFHLVTEMYFQEHKKKVEALEKEKQDFQKIRLDNLRQREDLQER